MCRELYALGHLVRTRRTLWTLILPPLSIPSRNRAALQPSATRMAPLKCAHLPPTMHHWPLHSVCEVATSTFVLHAQSGKATRFRSQASAGSVSLSWQWALTFGLPRIMLQMSAALDSRGLCTNPRVSHRYWQGQRYGQLLIVFGAFVLEEVVKQ